MTTPSEIKKISVTWDENHFRTFELENSGSDWDIISITDVGDKHACVDYRNGQMLVLNLNMARYWYVTVG
jgi:hypothetical protein